MNNSYVIPLFIAGSILLLVFVAFLIGYLIIHKNKQNAYLLAQKQLIYEQEKRILEVQVEEHEKTLDEVSKELHDNVGHALGFIRMNMRVIAKNSVQQQEGPINTINSFLEKVIMDVRHISHSLSSDAIKRKGLVVALTETLDYINAAKNLECSINIKGEYNPFPEKTELAIFRIAQEAIANTLKHANAKRLDVNLLYSPSEFKMTFKDDGEGFESDKLSAESGIGLNNMQQRAKVMNGRLAIHSTPTSGCIVSLSVDRLTPSDESFSKN